ncbi:hemerythrin domain-containing protein [Caenispirillum salinarum]|uniref:hemerythrin domain-containing protein n=1 Tax=Caenispirillum salinarum TaxID=859058 RepID=UPI00384B4757
MNSIFGATRIGQALHTEHMRTMEQLDALESLIASRRPPAPEAATATLEGIARALDEDVTRHFAFEEEHLFPRLHDAGAGFMVDMLTGEHAEIRPLAESLRDACRALAAGGFDANLWESFRADARDLIDRETFHIQKEEMGLLAALSQVLDAAEDGDLADRHAALTAG